MEVDGSDEANKAFEAYRTEVAAHILQTTHSVEKSSGGVQTNTQKHAA